MVAETTLAQRVADFAMVLAERADVSEVTHRLAEAAVGVVPAEGAGVLLEDSSGKLHFATASDDLGRHLEEIELETGEGPCLTAHATGTGVDVPDVTADERFARFCQRARIAGIGSVYAFPLFLRGRSVGALDLVARRPLVLDQSERAAVQLIADVGMACIANSLAFAESAKVAEQLQAALDSRVIIEQAKGKLAGAGGVEIEHAFAVLRSYARTKNERLHTVSQELVDGTLSAADVLTAGRRSGNPTPARRRAPGALRSEGAVDVD